MLKRFCRQHERLGVIGIYIYIQAFALSSFLTLTLFLVIGSVYLTLSSTFVIITGMLTGLLAAVFIVSSVAYMQAKAIEKQRASIKGKTDLKVQQIELQQEHWIYLNHELRNMLAGQLMAARSLAAFFHKHPAYAEETVIANSLLYSLTQSDRLYNNVIDTERMAAGIFDVANKTAFPVREWLEEHCRHFKQLAAARSLDFSLSIAPQLPSTLLADVDKLMIILNNLLVNALTHTPANGYILVVANATPDLWILTVTNSGQEIPPAMLQVLFNKYATAEVAKAGKSGIGLYLSQQLASSMEGKIRVTSENGRTNFALILPLKVPADHERAISPQPLTPAHLYSDYLKDKTVLIMEDDALIRMILQRSLAGFGFTNILIATNGEDGAQMAEEHNPNFILLDIQMPGKHGDELLHELRSSEKTKYTPIIAITAASLAERETLQEKHKLHAVLPKPVPITDLFYTLTAS